ncbi:hypothetical protein [Chryseobacterium sp.]|uniref:hypothetical protein n=1 Tax=Chryseobacterium sp. TaxID=1871047 RepID=UPI0028977BD0|nr:hypothetical protein [Chryseobacterium sp.]
MSHQEKKEIFDQYAKSQEFEDWNDLKNCCIEFDMDIDEHVFAACDIVQEEQQKRIAEKALEIQFFGETDEVKKVVDFKSIINPENKIQ